MNTSRMMFLQGSHVPVILLAVALFSVLSYGKTAVPVFLLLGQSNMVSMASVNDLSADQKKNINNVMINANADCDPAKKGKWLPLGPGFGSQAANFGLELMLGKTLADSMPGIKIAFIKDATNGSALGQSGGWLPPSSNNGKGGTLYTNMITHIDAAIKSFGTAFDTTQYTPRWAGFVWLQGETDAMTQGPADAYEKNLGNLIKDIRTQVATPDLPVILPLITTVSMWTYSAKIRGADIVMKQTLKSVDTLETKEYATPDGMHYNAAGQLKIGQIAALRWLAMQYHYGGTVQIAPCLSRLSISSSKPTVLVTQRSRFDLSGRVVPAAGSMPGILIAAPAQVQGGSGRMVLNVGKD